MSESVYSLFKTFVLKQAVSLAGAFLQAVLAAKVYRVFDNRFVVFEVHRLLAIWAEEKGLPALRTLCRMGKYNAE